MLRYLDAGESHGRGITCVVEGMPRGVPLRAVDIEAELKRRRLGYGRGARMDLEEDRIEILSGVRAELTLGSPIAMLVLNAEFDKWKEIMSAEGDPYGDRVTSPRPGHADLAGAIKYGTHDIRDVLERASARETVGRVCAGITAKRLLAELEIAVFSHVVAVGGMGTDAVQETPTRRQMEAVDSDAMRCLDADISMRMREEVDKARDAGDSLGGIFQVIAFGVPAGLGSHVHWDRRLDSRLASAVMGIQAVKGCEIGGGFRLARMKGSQAADEIFHEEGRGFYRSTNHAGGMEGGISNGEPILLQAAMKPIPTLSSPLHSVDIVSKAEVKAAVERADTCAVPAAAVIAESCVAFVLADAVLEKTGGDSMDEIRERFRTMVGKQVEF